MLPTNHAYIATVVVLVALSCQTTCDTDVCGMIRYGPTANGVNISVKTNDIMVCDICNSQTNSIADTLNKQQTLCGKHAFSLSISARVLCLITGRKTTQQQPFYGPLSGTTRVSRYQKKHSPTHHPHHHPIFISFFHLPRSIASSLFKLRAWQSFCTTSLHSSNLLRSRCMTSNS